MNLSYNRKAELVCFYRPEQVCQNLRESYSKSPLKPELVVNRLVEITTALGAINSISMMSFPPLEEADFLSAHVPEYVTAFFDGKKPLCETNEIPWSGSFSESVKFTNASLFNAQEYALLNPEKISFSPTSGFHHARPEGGFGFCSFSGQVISALELFRKYGVSGAWIDLDGHFGNSIEDSRGYVPAMKQAIPPGCNINPIGNGKEYLEDLRLQLDILTPRILSGEISWLAFAQGTDSHYADDLANETDMIAEGKLSTKEWMEAAKTVYEWIAKIDKELGMPLPLTIALFGGYRADDFQSVIDLHVASLLMGLRTFDGGNSRWSFDLISTLPDSNYENEDKVELITY